MLIAIAMVKDEADIIGYTIDHLLEEGVDRIIVADNLSTDETRSILHGYADVHIIDDDVFGYYQSRKMTALARMAYAAGADWVLPFDADELILPPKPERLAGWFAACPADVGIVAIQGLDYLPRRDDDQDEPNPFRRLRYRRDRPQTLAKVAFRAHPDALLDMGNHDVRNVPGRRIGGLMLRHCQYRSLEQMTRKLRNGAAVYADTDIHEHHGTHWRVGSTLTDDDFAAQWERLLDEPGLWAPW
jgi:glycosyltransferase involved in cell wall biosynthesis